MLLFSWKKYQQITGGRVSPLRHHSVCVPFDPGQGYVANWSQIFEKLRNGIRWQLKVETLKHRMQPGVKWAQPGPQVPCLVVPVG